MPRELSARARRRILEHIERLNDPDQDVSARAENVLISYYADRVYDLVLPACAHPNPMVRLRAGWVIAHTGRPEAFGVLRELCEDPDDRVRYDTRVALGILGTAECIDLIFRQIEADDDEDGASWMGLGKMGPAIYDRLVEFSSHPDEGIRMAVANQLGFWALYEGHSASRVRLQGFLDDPSEPIRDETLFWLKEIEAQRSDLVEP